MKTEEIKNIMKNILDGVAELKKIYNDPTTSLKEMAQIGEYARLLDITDFRRSITD